MIFPESDEPSAGEAATSYTDEFFDAAVAKIDDTFGTGFAKKNPMLVAGYLQASATNLNAFMMAASSLPDFDESYADSLMESDDMPDGLAELAKLMKGKS